MRGIIVGLIFMIGGFSGNLVLIGTNSGTALGVIGIGYYSLKFLP